MKRGFSYDYPYHPGRHRRPAPDRHCQGNQEVHVIVAKKSGQKAAQHNQYITDLPRLSILILTDIYHHFLWNIPS